MPQTNVLPQPETRGKDHRKELYAVCAALSVLGMAFSSWASRVPDVRTAALLTAATLGYALLFRGVGTLTMMPVVAISINNFGAKKTMLATGLVVALSLTPIALMNNWIMLAAMLFVVGGCSSSYNIAVNALGSKVETESGKSHMSKIHSFFGVGNLTGAILGIVATKLGISVLIHFSFITILILITLGVCYQYLPEDAPHPEASRPTFQWPHGGLIAIGIICFLAATIENTINNWIGIFFKDHVKVSEGFVPVGYATFAGALLATRLIGDRLKTKYGARNVIVTGCSVATAGLVIAVFAPNTALVLAGFILAGSGVALNFPLVYSAAGREGAVALTSVATFGSIGGMVSQPVMGWIVTHFELVGGFLFIATASLIVVVLARRARLFRT